MNQAGRDHSRACRCIRAVISPSSAKCAPVSAGSPAGSGAWFGTGRNSKRTQCRSAVPPAFGHGDHPPAVGGRQHPRGAHPGLRPQRVHPGQLRGDLLLGVVAEPVYAQHRGPGVGVADQEGRVLRDVEQLDGRVRVTAVLSQRVLRAAPDPVHDVAAGRQVVLCHRCWPMATASRPATAESTSVISRCARRTSAAGPLR